MKILTNSDNIIKVIDENIIDQDDRYYVGISPRGYNVQKIFRMQDIDGNVTEDIITLHDVAEIPEGVTEQKYCYTEADGFYKNPNYVAPEKPIEEQVTDLQEAMAELAELIVGGNE